MLVFQVTLQYNLLITNAIIYHKYCNDFLLVLFFPEYKFLVLGFWELV
jgi:hypothetical protein